MLLTWIILAISIVYSRALPTPDLEGAPQLSDTFFGFLEDAAADARFGKMEESSEDSGSIFRLFRGRGRLTQALTRNNLTSLAERGGEADTSGPDTAGIEYKENPETFSLDSADQPVGAEVSAQQ